MCGGKVSASAMVFSCFQPMLVVTENVWQILLTAHRIQTEDTAVTVYLGTQGMEKPLVQVFILRIRQYFS